MGSASPPEARIDVDDGRLTGQYHSTKSHGLRAEGKDAKTANFSPIPPGYDVSPDRAYWRRFATKHFVSRTRKRRSFFPSLARRANKSTTIKLWFAIGGLTRVC